MDDLFHLVAQSHTGQGVRGDASPLRIGLQIEFYVFSK